MAAFAMVTVVALAGGCADSDARRDAISGVAVRLLTAAGAGDGAAACALLAPDTVEALEQSAGASCAEAVLDEDLPEPAGVRRVDVYGQWARVVLADDTEFLAAFPGGWRVVAAGCRSRGERPYDCVLQGG
ncbi:hypothetical protein Daura_24470 [Dactylosporangium aurantiacum]|uniref:Uncharacterized protein n=2 Tax=Dactylosporangium aurantiacum TaxID=35754 RepID=A0A9Q9ITY4_9ACTN|nr:hypothetical protein Daura_24470 [Dactylosporangium aurantiacum]